MTKNFVVIAFSVGLFATGVLIYKDFGVSWDEPIQRNYGQVVYNFITGRDKKLLSDNERYYGPAFELILITVEKLAALTDARDIYFARHFANFSLFFVGVFFFYLICKKRFGSYKWGLFGASFLVLSPRIFAHAFYNSKDIPLMAFLIISFYTLTKLVEKPTTARIILHSLACALAISTRVVGVAVIFMTAASFVLSKDRSLKYARIFAAFFFAFVVFTILFWPTLWNDPLHHFVKALEQMSKYPQSTKILYFGELVKSTNLPWHYVLGWIAVTTPTIYLAFFVAGLIFMVRELKKIPIHSVAVLLWFLGPLLAVILLKSVLYDEWRQMFFIYPALLLISMEGVKWALSISVDKTIKTAVALLIGVNLTLTAANMIRLHPFYNLYFNELAGERSKLAEKFEMDYWGLSYRKALEYIARNDEREKIVVSVDNFPGIANASILPDDARSRLVVDEKLSNADYFITTYRSRKERDTNNLWYALIVDGNIVAGVYKLR